MNSDFKKDLINARQLKNSGKYNEALEIFEKHYRTDSDEFKPNQKVDYAWTIIKSEKFTDNMFDSARFITEMLPQTDLNVKNSCPYTTAVFKVLITFKNNNDYAGMIPWLEKLNPVLLDDKTHKSYGKNQKSRRETYYFWLSKAYLDSYYFDECIDVSIKALDELKTFHDETDVWFKWRIAKSLKELNKPREALLYFKEVCDIKKEWYMYREIAECYCLLGKYLTALDYLCPAVLSKKSNKTKVNLYHLCYSVFKNFNHEMALKHAQLYYLIKTQNNYQVSYDIEKLDIDPDGLNLKELEKEITDLWTQYKYKNHRKYYGTVIKFFQDKNFGFIKSDNGQEIFFHKSDVISGDIFTGDDVSFCSEEYYSRSLNGKSVKAVNVRVE